MRQTARRIRDDTLIATAEFVFVCIDRQGKPVPVPADVGGFMNARTGNADVRRLTVNGVNLAVDIAGEGPAVLFIHGYPLDRTLWRHQVDHLVGFRRIAPDLRGMGLSDAPDLGYSMTTYADDLAALLDSLGVDEVALVGLSLGGYVAFEFVRRWRRRVRALVLMDTRSEADSAEGRRARDLAAAAVREGGPAAIADAMMPKLFAREDPKEVSGADEVRRMILASPAAGIAGALGAMRDRPDSTSLLPTLGGIPTLVVVGEDDRVTPPDTARAMAEAIPGARLQVVPGAGHLTPIEQPAVTTRLLAEFLSSLPAR
jgi:pimeloyl-ACP methyl ester carboxylesterase